jgi:hypothetical protein
VRLRNREGEEQGEIALVVLDPAPALRHFALNEVFIR